MIGERDIGEKTARFILEVAEHGEVLDAILDGFDVAVSIVQFERIPSR